MITQDSRETASKDKKCIRVIYQSPSTMASYTQSEKPLIHYVDNQGVQTTGINSCEKDQQTDFEKSQYSNLYTAVLMQGTPHIFKCMSQLSFFMLAFVMIVCFRLTGFD